MAVRYKLYGRDTSMSSVYLCNSTGDLVVIYDGNFYTKIDLLIRIYSIRVDRMSELVVLMKGKMGCVCLVSMHLLFVVVFQGD